MTTRSVFTAFFWSYSTMRIHKPSRTFTALTVEAALPLSATNYSNTPESRLVVVSALSGHTCHSRDKTCLLGWYNTRITFDSMMRSISSFVLISAGRGSSTPSACNKGLFTTSCSLIAAAIFSAYRNTLWKDERHDYYHNRIRSSPHPPSPFLIEFHYSFFLQWNMKSLYWKPSFFTTIQTRNESMYT